MNNRSESTAEELCFIPCPVDLAEKSLALKISKNLVKTYHKNW